MTKKQPLVFDSPRTHSTKTGKKFPPPQSMAQRRASTVNWHLKVVTGALGSISNSLYRLESNVVLIEQNQVVAYRNMLTATSALTLKLAECVRMIEDYNQVCREETEKQGDSK